MTRSALYCEHANEAPSVCSCDDDCYCKENSCINRATSAQRWINRVDAANELVERLGVVFSHELDEPIQARASAVAVDARCAAAHKEELAYAAWAAALVTVLVCLGQLAAERASPKIVGSRFKWMEVD